jgi:SPP1 gp7 family putative phage head morphogenesis protein
MILGKSPDDAIKAIADKFGASKKNAARLVQTEAAYFMNEAQKAAFEGLDVEEFEVVGTLDGITCHVCGGLDGSHLPMSQFEAGVTAPPYHPNCRCCIAPYFDDNEGERIARDEDGKRYYISQEMTFKDWKEKFVDGGGKSGLKPIDNGGVVSWVKDDLKNSAVSGIIEMGTLDKSLGTVHADQMREILNDSPDNVKGVWNNYADRLQVETIHSKKGAFCNNRGISVDIDHVSHEEKYMGEIAKKPYYTVYHEFGHNIDRIASQERGEYRSLADTFKSSIHTGNNGLGYTLTEMLEQEGTQRVSDIWAALKKEAIAAGGKASDIKKFKAYQAISVEIRAKPVLSTTDISDMWDGITKEVVRPHYGHGKSYWKTHTVGVEAFAEMFSATVMNPESVAQIQYYFPKSYEIFEEIISELGVIK